MKKNQRVPHTPELKIEKILLDTMSQDFFSKKISELLNFQKFTIAVNFCTNYSYAYLFLIDNKTEELRSLYYKGGYKLDPTLKLAVHNKDLTHVWNYDIHKVIYNHLDPESHEIEKGEGISLCFYYLKYYVILTLYGRVNYDTDLHDNEIQRKIKCKAMEIVGCLFELSNKIKKTAIQSNEKNASLTSMEVDILRYAADGFTSKEIASKLYLSKSGVDFHFVRLAQKLACKNKTHIIAKAISLCLI